MSFINLPLTVNENGQVCLKENVKAGRSRSSSDRSATDNEQHPYSYPLHPLNISDDLLQAIRLKNNQASKPTAQPLTRIGGSLAFHCTIDLANRQVVETASMSTLFRGYESILRGRDLRQVGLVSSASSSICGGVHATASALCLEMALGLQPPPLGIITRNLLLSCQYLNDNPMHLFLLSGPDYSEAAIRQANPEIWRRAEQATARYSRMHGYQTIAEICVDLNRPQGKLYLESLKMIRLAREAYAILGGKYPHSESIIPGGVSITPTLEKLDQFLEKLEPFYDYAKKCVGIWDDIFDFLYQANPEYYHLGKTEPTMVDFGQWDHEDYYDGRYENCNGWGEKRWSTPGAIVKGELATTRIIDLNLGFEEFVDFSYYHPWSDYPFKTDPLGNPLSPYHPWNKTLIPLGNPSSDPLQVEKMGYSWGCTPTWDRNTFEVGAYARLYLSALAQKLPNSSYLNSTGQSLIFNLPKSDLPEMQAEWKIPPVWNAFERNRARAYAIAFNLTVTIENYQRAKALLIQGQHAVSTPLKVPETGRQFGAGFWGASRGFLAHWAILENGTLSNYQVSIPSRVNASPRAPWGELGACEQAVLNTPIIETNFKDQTDFRGIDILRAIQSFDPCLSCTTHIRVEDNNTMLEREVTTSCAI